MSEEKSVMDFEKVSEQHLSTWNRMIVLSKAMGVFLALILLGLLVIYFN